MDDFIKIFIWIAIIFFWFLRPLLKKKVPEKKPDYPKSENDNRVSVEPDLKEYKSDNVVLNQRQDQYDILKEIEKMFGSGANVPAPQPKSKQEDPYDIYESSEIKDKDLSLQVDKRLQRDVMDHNPIGYRKAYDNQKADYRRSTLRNKSKVDAKTATEAQKFEMVLAGLDKKIIAQNKFKSKIKTSTSLKEYILFSEILGKPKALRR